MKGRLKVWKGALELKKLRINVKTKMMISSEKTGKVTIEVKFPSALCRKGVGNNSTQDQFCSCWLHKRFSGIRA